tara:strand:- start:3047 stop:3460 length:414 start_codon:yes stop_codon:yes gene_type:complete
MGWCGCDVYVKSAAGVKCYSHTIQLDMIRNAVGPSVCHHNKCGVSCETAAELRRHLCGTAKTSDKHPNCKEATTKCLYCHTYGKREFIEGVHYNKYHSSIVCTVCNCKIPLLSALNHYNYHCTQLLKFKSDIEQKNK